MNFSWSESFSLNGKYLAPLPISCASEIVDGDTFDVSPQWKWNNKTGSRVRPAGYYAPELYDYGGQAAKDKLSRLINGEQVNLQTVHRVDRGRLVCEVYLGNMNLADYFPEYQ